MVTALVVAAVVLAAAAVALAAMLLRARENAIRAAARLGELERGIATAEKLREEMANAAKAAVLETAQQVSSNLIDDHRREAAEMRKAAEERVQQTSDLLVKQVDVIAKAVAALDGQVQEKGRVLDTVWRSLSSPGGAGQFAEIGLANTLKGFGLETGRDYVLQATTEDQVSGQRLRPDALVFLPGNSAVVIDCKASKFVVEIAAAEDGADESEAYANLARTMNQHLKALADKNYRGAVQAAWRDGRRSGDLARVFSVMYLPNDGAVEKLCRADADFLHKAREAQIILAGPAVLHCLLSLAAVEINHERQVENQQRIIEAAQLLLDGVTQALAHAGAVGKGIKAAADSFQKLTGSVNQRLLPRARRLAALGVAPGRTLPANLPSYVVAAVEPDHLIEGEAAEVPEPPVPRLSAE
ncbi:MAG TPA: DNA recombination protein RmuC [Stellaceae bacterium]|nr:DNA recombination protein RmuC [Stellaceae bacterium]